MDENELNEATQAEISQTVANTLKDKYDPHLVVAYLRENIAYDRRAEQIKQDSHLNRTGRADMKRKYRKEGLATDDVDKFYAAALHMRSAGVPADKVNPLFNAINTAIDTGVVAGSDEPDEE